MADEQDKMPSTPVRSKSMSLLEDESDIICILYPCTDVTRQEVRQIALSNSAYTISKSEADVFDLIHGERNHRGNEAVHCWETSNLGDYALVLRHSVQAKNPVTGHMFGLDNSLCDVTFSHQSGVLSNVLFSIRISHSGILMINNVFTTELLVDAVNLCGSSTSFAFSSGKRIVSGSVIVINTPENSSCLEFRASVPPRVNVHTPTINTDLPAIPHQELRYDRLSSPLNNFVMNGTELSELLLSLDTSQSAYARNSSTGSVSEGDANSHLDSVDSRSKGIVKNDEEQIHRDDSLLVGKESTSALYPQQNHQNVVINQWPMPAKFFCPQCHYQSPGEPGLRRHIRTNHRRMVTVTRYVCRDPATVGLHSDLEIYYPMSDCRPCSSDKQYSSYYNAIAHLRRRHFNRKRGPGRLKHVEDPDERRRKEQGVWPSIADLKPWFKEIQCYVDDSGRTVEIQEEIDESSGVSRLANDIGGGVSNLETESMAEQSHATYSVVDDYDSLGTMSDIESVFSDGSLPSSQSSHSGTIHHIAITELAHMLLNDSELNEAFVVAIEKVGLDRCQRNFARFLRKCGKSLVGEASTDAQNQAARFVSTSARRVSVLMAQNVRPVPELVMPPEELVIGAKRLDDWLLSQNFVEVDKPDDVTNYMPVSLHLEGQVGEALSEESDSDVSDTNKRTQPIALSQMKNFMASSQAFSDLRTGFRKWIQLDREPDEPDANSVMGQDQKGVEQVTDPENYWPDSLINIFDPSPDQEARLTHELRHVENLIYNSLRDILHVSVDTISSKKGTTIVAYICFINLASTHDKSDIFIPPDDDLQGRLAGVIDELEMTLPSHIIPKLVIPCKFMPEVLFSALHKKELLQITSRLDEAELAKYSTSNFNRHSHQTPMEISIANLWAEILQIPMKSINRHDSFVALGGDSISTIQLASKARDAGILFSVKDVFDDSRLSTLAAKARQINENDAIINYTDLPFRLLDEPAVAQCRLMFGKPLEDAYPVSKNQESLMALSVKQPDSNIAKYVYSLPDTMDIARFQAAWQRIVALCPILRSRIVLLEGNQCVQAVLSEDIDWQSTKRPDISQAINTAQKTQMSYGSVLSQYSMAQDNDGVNYFLWTIHHAVHDDWNVLLLLNACQCAYNDLEIPALRPYSSFVKYTTYTNSHDARLYWAKQLKGSKQSCFLLPEPMPLTHGAKFSVQMDIITTTSQTLSQTRASVIRAAWSIVIATNCKSLDVCFGAVNSGRQAPVDGLVDTPGPVVTTVPVRIRLDLNQSIRDYLQEIQDQAKEMVPYEQFGMHNIAEINPNTRAACDFAQLLVIQPAQNLKATAKNTDQASNLDFVALTSDYDNTNDDNISQLYRNYPLVIQCSVLDNNCTDLMLADNTGILGRGRLVILGQQFEQVLQQLSSAREDVVLGSLTIQSQLGFRPLDSQQLGDVSPEHSEQFSLYNLIPPRTPPSTEKEAVSHAIVSAENLAQKPEASSQDEHLQHMKTDDDQNMKACETLMSNRTTKGMNCSLYNGHVASCC